MPLVKARRSNKAGTDLGANNQRRDGNEELRSIYLYIRTVEAVVAVIGGYNH